MSMNMADEINFFKVKYKKNLEIIKNDIKIYLPHRVMSDILDSTHKDFKTRPVQTLDEDILKVKFENIFDSQIFEPKESRMSIKMISNLDISELKKLIEIKAKDYNTVRTQQYKFNQVVPHLAGVLDKIIEENEENEDWIETSNPGILINRLINSNDDENKFENLVSTNREEISIFFIF